MSIQRKSIIIFDGNCGFCKQSVDWMRKWTGENVIYTSSQEAAMQYPEISPEDFAKAVQLIEPDGTIKSGANAILSALALHSIFFKIILWKYNHIFGVAALSEWVYRWIAKHRSRSCIIR